MTSNRPFHYEDLFGYNNVNVDPLTETYSINFYNSYLGKWPELCLTSESLSGNILGYMIGKSEGEGKGWRGHVTAVTVDPDFRGLGIGTALMDWLEKRSTDIDAWFVDLFVKCTNEVARRLYHKLGYVDYRRVINYYSTGEDGMDMRKALPRDINRETIIAKKKEIYPEELD